MLHQRCFELERGHVLPAAPQRILLAVDEPEVPVLVDAAAVSGVVPEVTESLDGGRVIAPVAGEQTIRLLRADHDLTGLSRGHLDVALIDDLDLQAGRQLAHAARLAYATRVAQQRWPALGLPEDLSEGLDAEALRELLDECRGRRHEGDVAQLVLLVLRARRCSHDRHSHGAHAHRRRRTRLADTGHVAGRAEGRLDDGGSPDGQGGGHEPGLAAEVEQGVRTEDNIALGVPAEIDKDVDEVAVVPVRNRAALRRTRGPRRVDDGTHIRGREGHRVEGPRRALKRRERREVGQRRRLRGFPDDHQVFDAVELRQHGLEHLQSGGIADVDARCGLCELVPQEVATQVGVQRDLDRSGLSDRVDENDVLDAVGKVDRHAVTFTDAKALKGSRHSVREPVEFPERHPGARALHEVPVGVARSFVPQPVA